jgi:Tfp pilus assembly protein PilZ
VSLSEGGMYIRDRNPFSVGAEIEVALPLKDEKTINLKGTVIYVKGLSGDVFKVAPGMAIEFKELNSDDSAMLKAYITELLTQDIIEGRTNLLLQ